MLINHQSGTDQEQKRSRKPPPPVVLRGALPPYGRENARTSAARHFPARELPWG